MPEELRRFLDANVDSVEQLELLRIVGEHPGRQWKIQELAGRIQCSPAAIAVHVSALKQRNLLITEMVETEVCCSLNTNSPEMERMLRRLLQFYNERPVTLIKILYGRRT